MQLKKNKGFSLVELIVTVAILAIIVLPLLRAFVVSARTNASAKEKLRSTEVAQNIMEGLKTTDLESLAYQMNKDDVTLTFLTGAQAAMEVLKGYGSDGSSVKYSAVKRSSDITLPGNLTTLEQRLAYLKNRSNGVTASVVTDTVDSTVWEYLGQDSKEYYFAVKGLSSDGSKFDALIYASAADSEGGYYTTANSESLVSLNLLDQEHDAIAIANIKPDVQVAAIEGVSSQQELLRKIIVDITEETTASGNCQKVVVTYQYYPVSGGALLYENSSPVFDNSSDTGRQLNNVYLFFYPWYTSTSAANPTDRIIINNNDDLSVGVVLVKQKLDSVSGIETLENNYRVDVRLNENLTSETASYAKLRTNLDTNLYTGNDTVDKQAVLSLDGNITSEAVAKIQRDALLSAGATDRILSVTVSVYPSGSYDNGFENVEPLISLTGGMRN